MKVFVVLAGLFSAGLALSIGNFTTFESKNIHDVWKNLNADNVREMGTNFLTHIGAGELWLVSKRLHRPNTESPWDPALRGGVVSTLQLQSKVWRDKPYDRVDEDPRGEVVFVAADRLFMLTYDTANVKPQLRKLFYWNRLDWAEIPLEIGAFPGPTGDLPVLNLYSIPAIDVAVGKSSDKRAYIALSAHGRARDGSEIDFLQLDIAVNQNSSTPVQAKVEPLVRHKGNEPSAVMAMAVKDDKVIALLADFLSEGYVFRYNNPLVLQVSSKQVTQATSSGAIPRPHARTAHNFFQKGDQAFITGGMYTYGLGQVGSTNQTWALDLNTLQWSEGATQLPSGLNHLAFDETNNKLYSVTLEEGVKVADVTV